MSPDPFTPPSVGTQSTHSLQEQYSYVMSRLSSPLNISLHFLFGKGLVSQAGPGIHVNFGHEVVTRRAHSPFFPRRKTDSVLHEFVASSVRSRGSDIPRGAVLEGQRPSLQMVQVSRNFYATLGPVYFV